MDIGIIVDVETTGLDSQSDKIIEIGVCEFGWTSGEPPRILSMYSGLEDPKMQIPEEISRITGIYNLDVQGRAINWDYVRAAWQRASVVIAHNAEFDRGFLTRRPELRDLPKHWCCSVRHIDWPSKGFGTRKLTYLAAEHGFINPFAHRAMFDCATTFRLVAPHLSELIEQSYLPEVRISAFQSPFESKDILKNRGYKWQADQRVWQKTIRENQIIDERKFLEDEVYKGAPRHKEEIILFNTPA